MECPYCRTVNRDGTSYCNNCGKFIGSIPSSSSASSVSDTTISSNLSGPSRSLVAGARLQGGRYIVKQVLGQGGMGAALLATDIRLASKAVVIKELISDNVDQTKLQEDVRNFKREVATLAHIDHPLVPNVTDHFQEGNRYFMVQEYVEGENLEVQLERTKQPLEEREVLICASQILDILDYLSQQTPPIVHRDIKPANIIISSRDRRAHLVDFGIARAEAARNTQRKQTSALGTPGYAPPEQYQGNADPRSDLYALAATLHHLLTNRDPRDHPPFNYLPVRMLNPLLSPEIEQILIRTLNNDINQRYQSAVAMKQDIDNILHQRYGASGNIDNYTLGTSINSGTINTIQKQNVPSAANLSTFVKASAINPAPVTLPVSQLSGSSNVSAGYSQLSNTPGTLTNVPLPPQRRQRTGLAVTILIILLLLLSGGGYLTFTHFRSLSPAGIGVTEIGNEPIGISDGSFAFDTTLADGSLKSQAAQIYKQSSSNVSQVTSLLNQAIAKSSNDGEALIYQEDLRVVNSGGPYVTIVVATFLSGGNIGVGRDDLQGAYVAQKEFNDGSKLYGGEQVRVLVANTGSKTAYVSNITQQITQLAQNDKTFVGVMGWPFSSYTLSAVKVLSSAKIPLVSQTASSDALTNASPYFFRVVPSNRQQGIQGSQYAINTLHSKNVALFYDQQDPYSQSLAQDFQQEFQKDGGKVVAEEKYTVGQVGTLPAELQDALKKNPDLIYFSGYADDVSTLLANQLPESLPVLGGDALYELKGYSSSARASGFTHLHFTAFAYPDEWDVLGLTSQKPPFFSEYPQDFDPNSLNQGSPYGFTRADTDAILSYDATVTLLSGCNIALSSGKHSLAPGDLQQALKKLNGANAIQGVSGQIALGPDGNPINKAIVLLIVDSDGHIKMNSSADILGQFVKQ